MLLGYLRFLFGIFFFWFAVFILILLIFGISEYNEYYYDTFDEFCQKLRADLIIILKKTGLIVIPLFLASIALFIGISLVQV